MVLFFQRIHFRCSCELCTRGTLHINELIDDPSFKYVSSHATDDNFVTQHCIEFIRRHQDMTRSEEFTYIANTLAAVFSKELNL